jgi:PadR family transcriptional regulator, regulatory protein AphA
MSLRHALLGLLYEEPASGYDLLQIFKKSLHNTWPATQSQVYTELTRLADTGLLTVTERGPRGRKEYSITDAGVTELRRWLLDREPEPHPRSETLLRVFLLGAVTRDQARDYLTWIADRAADDLTALKALGDTIAWNHEDLSHYGALVLEFGKRLAVMSEEWAQWAASQIPPDETSRWTAEDSRPRP